MKRKDISRREFITITSLGVTGAYAGLHAGLAHAMMGSGGMGGGGMGGGTTIIDPPPGASFEDPPTASPDPISGQIVLRAAKTTVTLNGASANLLTYNGSYPGPTIRAKAGDLLQIKLINSLDGFTGTNMLGHERSITNLHTHGLHVSPSGNSDNMGIMLAPGESRDYAFNLMTEDPGHINLYHPHIHGNAAEQYWGGLMGALVIEDEPFGALRDYETHVMVLKDISLSGGAPTPYTSTMEYMHGKEGNLVMVNGQTNPRLAIRPGQVQRWQIVNGCNARFFKLSLDRHSMYLVGTDGGLLDKPYRLSSILLSPGERIDVLVKADQGGGSFKFLSLPYSRGGSSTLQQVTLLTLEYGGTGAPDSLPGTFNRDAVRLKMNTSSLPRRRLTLSMMRGKGYINGISFEGMDKSYKFMSMLAENPATPVYEVWEIVNQSGMDHPFHQHVNPAQVLSITGGDQSYTSLYATIPAWKDTVIIPKMGSATLLVRLKDYAGMTMYHCHIMEHEDIGMMGVWDIMGMGM